MKPLESSFLLVIITLIFSRSLLSAPTKPSTKPNDPTVFVNEVAAMELFDRMTYPAKIQPRVEANLVAEMDAVIEKIHANLGHRVDKGQILITLRHTDPVYQYAPVHVRSSVKGIVSQLDFTEGSRVTRGQRLMVVIDPLRPKVIIELAAADLGDISIGMTGELKPVGQEKSTQVKVVGISPFIDSATGTATCELEIVTKSTDKPAALPPGLMGKVAFKVRERKGIQLPESAVIFRGKEAFVRIVENDIVKLFSVKLGNLYRGSYEITDGIKTGMSVVIRSSQYVADGQHVTVQTEEKSQFE